MAWTLRAAEAIDEAATVALWRQAGLVAPYNDPNADFRFALSGACSDVLLVTREDGSVAGGVVVGHDGHRGWIYYLAARERRVGIGKSLIDGAERWLSERGVPKLHLIIRPEHTEVVAFYEILGFEVSPCIVMAKWLEPHASSSPTSAATLRDRTPPP